MSERPAVLRAVAPGTGVLNGLPAEPQPTTAAFLRRLRAMSFRGLARMYDPKKGLFVFRLDRTAMGVTPQGHSLRYTAITLLGLANEKSDDVARVTSPHTPHDVCTRMLAEAAASENLGDVALSLVAAGAMKRPDLAPAAHQLARLWHEGRAEPVVEMAWTLMALTVVPEADIDGLRDSVARRVLEAFGRQSELFPHVPDAVSARSHVCCFADVIYPIQALSLYASATGHQQALDTAARCATRVCRLQGAAGQWWWHYDYRTGEIIEGYPVYAIHQDAMGPMGLLALKDAGGPDFTAEIVRGLKWLASSPELGGASLVDEGADLIWRKVARREPLKAARYVQAATSRLHPSLRMPAVDLVFPATAVDYEDRPYHLGWLLHAWPASRVEKIARMENEG